MLLSTLILSVAVDARPMGRIPVLCMHAVECVLPQRCKECLSLIVLFDCGTLDNLTCRCAVPGPIG